MTMHLFQIRFQEEDTKDGLREEKNVVATDADEASRIVNTPSGMEKVAVIRREKVHAIESSLVGESPLTV